MSDQVTINPRHPSVSVEDLIERLHADGWRAVELRVAPEPMLDGRRHIAWASRRIGDGPRFVALSDLGGKRWITHHDKHVTAEVWEHSTGAALAALVELLDEHRIDEHGESQ